MSDPYIGEIRMFAGNFPPRSWALCNGQLIAINDNNALFSLVGTTYGGDGRTSFGLPDMRGRVPLHHGNGPGLTPRTIGQKLGVESVTLNPSQIPAHTHSLKASTDTGTQDTAAGAVLASQPGNDFYYAPLNEPKDKVGMRADVITNSGGSLAHTNMMPTQCLSFIIAQLGIYPSRN